MSPRRLVPALLLLLAAPPALAQVTLRAYGPGGPAPAMKEAAAAFGKARGATVEITAGPTDTWIARAREDADVIFSGAEYMMTDFVKQLADTTGGGAPPRGRIDEATIEPLYLRPAAILDAIRGLMPAGGTA